MNLTKDKFNMEEQIQQTQIQNKDLIKQIEFEKMLLNFIDLLKREIRNDKDIVIAI